MLTKMSSCPSQPVNVTMVSLNTWYLASWFLSHRSQCVTSSPTRKQTAKVGAMSMSVSLMGAKSVRSDIQLAFQTNITALGLTSVETPPGEHRLNLHITLCWLNTLRQRQNGHQIPDDIFKCIFLNENIWISLNISLKFVPKSLIENMAALVQTMAWRRPGNKALSEPMMVSLLAHICVTRPQWVKPDFHMTVSGVTTVGTFTNKDIVLHY